jgi:uncharacterized surface protein with fasciclin (FAS1) repeats
MKKVFEQKAPYLILTFLFLVLSCNLDDDADTIPVPDSNIVDLAIASPELSTLVTALQRANLASTLEGSGPFTVLAPNNDAFDNFLSLAGFASVEDVPVDVLSQLLLNHVLEGRLDTAPLINLGNSYLETSASGPVANTNLALYFRASDDIIFNGISSIEERDIVASNGIIHIVDAVIPLPTIETFVAADENLEDLETALDLISPVSDIPSFLADSQSGPFTIFAPLNQAFDDLLATNDDWDFLSDIAEDLLTSVLAHHTLNGNIRISDISSGQTSTTLEGDDITFNIVAGNISITDATGNDDIGVDGAFNNIQTVNGVIHVINKVMIPDTTN